MADKSINEFKEAMNVIKARGFVTDNNLNSNALYKYDFKTGRFIKYDKNKLYKLFNRVYLNSYDVNYSIGAIINELPQLNFNQVNNYYKYNDVKDNILDIKELKKELQIYLDENQANKKEFAPIRWKPQSQLQHLINNDVFTNGKLLCRYNPGNDTLNYIAPKDLIKLFRDVKNQDYLSQRGLMDNYIFFIRNVINIKGLYDKFQDYYKTQNILTKYKNDYDAIKKVIDTFN